MLIEWEGRGVNFFCQSFNLPTYPPVFYPPYILTYRPTNFIPSYKTTQLIKLEEACQWSSFSHVENSPILPTFCFTSLCAWSRKLATSNKRSDAKLISITTRFHALAVFLLLFWPLRSLWFWFYEIITTTVLLTMVVGTSGVQFGLWSCEWFTKSDDCEAGVRFVNHECDYRQNWTTRSPVTN